jgi:hypothetical protein
MPATLTGDALHTKVWLHMAEHSEDMTPSHKAQIDIAGLGEYTQGQSLTNADEERVTQAIATYTSVPTDPHFVVDGQFNFDDYVLEPA